MSFHHSLNHDTKTLSRETSQARGVTLRARLQTKYPSIVTWTAVETVQLSSPCQPNATLLVPRQSMLRHVVTWRCETSSRQCSGVIHSPVVGHVTLTRISSKLPAARSLPRPSTDCGRRSRKANDVMELQTTSCHDFTCAVCLQYCVKVLRHSVFFVCLSVDHAEKLACPQL